MANTLVEFSNELANAVEQGGKHVVAVPEGGRNGVSGTVWAPGVIVTAEHTIRGSDEVTVSLASGEQVSAEVAGRDPSTDLAVLKVSQATVAAEFADPAQLKPGHVVLALGRRSEGGLTASYGVVSAVGGAWRTWHGGRMDQWLRLDLNPYPGFSGGPLVDAAGRVLGINTSGPRRGVLTIPKATVDRVVQQLLTKGKITRGFLGIGSQPVVVRASAEKGRAETPGLLVMMVTQGGPAEQAGMMVGDIIVSIDGHTVAEPGDLLAVLEPETVGKTLPVRVLRGGTPAELKVKIGEREAE